MEEFSIKKAYGERFDNIWNEFKLIKETERGYSIQDTIYLNSLFFICSNPSYKNDPHKLFYNYESVKHLPYFKKFPSIANAVNMRWSHIDLFFVRETRQKHIENYYNGITGSVERSFLEKQLKIATEIIIKSKPKVIVVSNAFAGRIFKTVFQTEFDNNIGTHRIKGCEQLKNTPVFYTSMLTGQRSLDWGSLERLKWHLHSVIQSIC